MIVHDAAIATGAWGVNALRGWLREPVAASDAPEAPRGLRSAPGAPRRRSARPVPAWARTDHHRYEEAA